MRDKAIRAGRHRVWIADKLEASGNAVLKVSPSVRTVLPTKAASSMSAGNVHLFWLDASPASIPARPDHTVHPEG
jgi:hypothetical protein